jgi:hypothetical protein
MANDSETSAWAADRPHKLIYLTRQRRGAKRHRLGCAGFGCVGEIDQPVDLAEQLLRGSQDFANIGEDIDATTVPHVLDDQLAVAFDRIERRAQIVSNSPWDGFLTIQLL